MMAAIMDAGEREKQMGSRTNLSRGGARLYSVGHSNHDWPAFVALLRLAGVTALADVRSSPFSRRHPHFNRPELERGLGRHGIAYQFLGNLLGGRPGASELYDQEGWVDYERVRVTAAFRRGLDQLMRGLEDHTVAMLCSEDDPLDCHRGLMITPALVEQGVAPLHLRRDGSAETTAEMERRLLQETRVDEAAVAGLFAAMLTDDDRRQILAKAYRVMNRRKAYKRDLDEEA
jgi:uncharacterized protein (DUF488 family)